MVDRASCERRVYRLAVLLSGNPNAAGAVIRSVLGAQPDLRKLDSSHLDRLTVLRSREVKPAAIMSDAVPLAVAAALAGLTAQQREAWVFHHVYRLPEREMAKAMDCSMHAISMHLQAAEEHMAKVLGGPQQAHSSAKALLAYTLSLDVPKFYRTAMRSAARMRRIMRWALIAIIVGILMTATLYILHRSGVLEPLIRSLPSGTET
ncbi:MAG: hypothetical protein ACR2GY_10150 [Phycisphaerales bacterium]